MRWENERESSNVDDNRGRGGGFGGSRIPVFGRGKLSLGTLAVILIGGWLLGVNPLTLLGMLEGGVMPPQQQSQPQHVPSTQQQGSAPAASDEAARFVRVVLGSTEDVWHNIFRQSGTQYTPPRLELFTGATRTACGVGQAGAGPFYCPADRKIYIDLSFFRVLQSQLGAGGDTAEAYVIAHEVGHHIQNLTGTLQKMEQARQRLNQAQYNQLSVRLELQADCYAGIWANHSQQAKNWFEAGDIEEAMNAAAAVGDDAIQGRQGGHVHQDSFTHGTSQQRLHWFRVGYQHGSVQRCDTFTNQQP